MFTKVLIRIDFGILYTINYNKRCLDNSDKVVRNDDCFHEHQGICNIVRKRKEILTN